MKKTFILVLFILSSAFISAQVADTTYQTVPTITKRATITAGFLYGGGSFIGVDFEFLAAPKVGLQIGAGYIGFGGGINYHLKPEINSSFVSLEYWHQGIKESFAQDAIGGVFTFRAKKLLSATLGLGIPLSKGPALDADFKQPPVMLLYAIGLYLPL
jgi:hypothetical protein